MESTQPILRCRYSYDPLDRLISQLQPDAPAHQRFYCKSRLATEIQGAIGHSIIQHDDWLLAQQQRQGDSLDTTLLATDIQRSVLHTLKANHQRQPIAYSPYGHRRAESGLSSLLGFNGERSDPVTGHYLLGKGYRAFNPVLMRFNSSDTLSPFGEGGLNSYAYCSGDPVNFNDPTGHTFLSWLFQRLTSTPIHVGNGMWSRAGVTVHKAQAKYSKFQRIHAEVDRLSFDVQKSTFEKDKLIAFTAEASYPRTPGQLEQLAYEKLRPTFSMFDNPGDIASKFQSARPNVIENAAKFEQAKYAPLLREVDNIISENIAARLGAPDLQRFDQRLVNSYKARMKSVTEQKVHELTNEARRIRNKYFQN